jgi:hypothetical protein
MIYVMKFDYSSSRETCVRRERSNNAVVSAVESYSSDVKGAAGLGEANMSASMILRLTEIT